MPSLFQAMEIGKRALLSSQYTLQTIGHNIANVNTPGYTRQRVIISASAPGMTPYGALGTGIQVDNVIQIRDLFLGAQFRDATKAAGKWQYREKTLSNIQSMFNEPNANALGDQLDKFWESWDQLSTADKDSRILARKDVVGKAETLVSGLNQLARKLGSQQQELNRDLENMTLEVNRLTDEIARINAMVQRNEGAGNPANDLRDSRDYLIDQLSELVDVNTIAKSNGGIMVHIGAMIVVDGSDSFEISTNTVSKKGRSISELVWKGTTIKLSNKNGQMAGLMEARDIQIPEYLAQLDELARTIVEEVNAVHRTGYGLDGSTNVNFFDPNNLTAATIRVNAELNGAGVEKVASSGFANAIGDNSIAARIYDLAGRSVAANGTMTINDFYYGLVGKLGVQTQEAISFTANNQLLIQQVDNARQSVQGVSLDEEMTNLVKFQHAYDAAARVITTMDQALDTVINGMGMVGR